jgi:glycosyltransferase involved in cell wall biosynthesis
MRVLFYTASFTERRGGVEKRFCVLANELAERGAEVRVLAARDRASPRPKFPLHPSVQVHFAKVEKESVRALLEEFAPDVLITVNGRKTSHLLDQLAGLGTRVIVTEQQNPADMARIMGSERARLANLARADRIHVLLPSYKASLPPELSARCTVIPNQCTVPGERADASGAGLAAGTAKRIIYIARLDRHHKRQQVLIEAFGRVRKRFEDWELWLWGDPADFWTRVHLRSLVWLRGLSGKVFLPGPTDDVTREYLKSQLLVFPAAFEGFPQSLLQGMSCGLPCIGFAGCAGVNELIADSVTGLLAPGSGDAGALAEKMAVLMANPGLRAQYGAAGREVASDYTYQRFLDGWLDLVNGLTDHAGQNDDGSAGAAAAPQNL